MEFPIALERFADAVEKSDVKKRRLKFSIDPASTTNTVSITLRDLSALRILFWITQSQSVSAQIQDGKILITAPLDASAAMSGRPAKTSAPKVQTASTLTTPGKNPFEFSMTSRGGWANVATLKGTYVVRDGAIDIQITEGYIERTSNGTPPVRHITGLTLGVAHKTDRSFNVVVKGPTIPVNKNSTSANGWRSRRSASP